MARKLDRKKAVAAEDDSAAAQLAVLNPQVTLTLAGRKFTIREYGYFEGLQVAHDAAAFIADIHDICRDGELRYDRIRRLFGVHQQVVIDIAAQAAGVEADWVRGLERADAEAFMSSWFGVNAGFFVREVLVEMREERQRAAMRSTGSISSPGSPPPGTETSSASAGSPSVN